MTMPLATPIEKISAKMRTQNFVISRCSGFLVRSHTPSMMTRISPRPMDSGGKT